MTTQTEIVSATADTTPEGVTESPSKVRAAILYCGNGALTLLAQEADIGVVYAHDPQKRNREALLKKTGIIADSRGMKLDFTTIPNFNTLLLELPKDKPDRALSFFLEFLGEKYPSVFIVVGQAGDDENRQTSTIHSNVQQFSYGAASGGRVLRGNYKPLVRERPVTIGMLCFDPTNMSGLILDTPADTKEKSNVEAILQRVKYLV